MHPTFRRYALIALSILGSATLLFSCKNDVEPTRYDNETLMTESSKNRTITMMENGKRSYVFTTPLIEGYSLATNPYQEFRRGIHMTTYASDSLALINATIQANYAIYYEKQRLWEAKGNVIVKRFNRGDKDTTITDTMEIHTQQLFWNATTEKIYSNVDTKVLQKDGWHFGVGFDADEDLKNIHFRKYSSEMEFEMSQPNRERDSLSNNRDNGPTNTEEARPARPAPTRPEANKAPQNRPTPPRPDANGGIKQNPSPARPGQPNREMPTPGARPPQNQMATPQTMIRSNVDALSTELSTETTIGIEGRTPPPGVTPHRTKEALRSRAQEAKKTDSK